MNSAELQRIKQRYNIVGNCDALNQVLDVALQVAPTDLSVLIIGESGVGKEIIPRVIHDNSPRRREKYFAINCGSIPEGTIDSELFGHVKGSYTGAINDSPGYFGVADKGTLFLDNRYIPTTIDPAPIHSNIGLWNVSRQNMYNNTAITSDSSHASIGLPHVIFSLLISSSLSHVDSGAMQIKPTRTLTNS